MYPNELLCWGQRMFILALVSQTFSVLEVHSMTMKAKLTGLSLATALAATALPSGSAQAAAYGANFQVAITYQNVGAAASAVQFDFYPEANGTAVTFTPSGQLAAGASNSIAVGSVAGVTPGFKGSAVLSANQPVVATIVQFSDNAAATGITNRLLSNGFTPADAATRQLVPTVIKNAFGVTSYFSVQNVESTAVNLTVRFYRAGETTAAHTETFNNLAPNAAKYFDAGQIAALGTSFNGSAVVEGSGRTVVTVNELETVKNGGKSFEGTAKQSGTIYMPTALCKAFPNAQFPNGSTSFYAVQNAALTGEAVEFRVVFQANGQTYTTPNIPVAPGSKAAVDACATIPAGASGSAVIEVQKGSGTLVAVGKVDGLGITSAFLGQSTGASRLATPYVRWAKAQYNNTGQRQRAFLAVQNVGTGTATNVRVRYINRDGQTVGTHTIGTLAAGAKAPSTPELGNALDACGRFGEYGASASDPCLGTSFGGGAIIEADSGSLTAIVRIATGGTNASGEDYTALSIPNATQQ